MSFNSGMKGADVVALLKNGLPIVDDVNKLDPNAEVGSMASVAIPGSIQEISLSELPQPDASIMDETTGVIDASNCPLVSGLSVIVPTGAIPVTATIGYNDMIYFVSESMDMNGMTFGSALCIMSLAENGELSALTAMYMDIATMTQQEFVLFSITDGVVTTDQDAINQVNTLINGLHYIGAMEYVLSGETLPSEILDVYDLVVKVVAGVPSSADIYVKTDSWELLHKKDLEKLTKDLKAYKESCEESIKSVTESKANKIPVYTPQYYELLKPNVYNTDFITSTGSKSFKLAEIEDTTVYNEYILELKCTATPSSVSFVDRNGTALNIKWSNGIAPTFEKGFTYMISIVNGFGVYSTFING